jgi:hypothetical protein
MFMKMLMTRSMKTLVPSKLQVTSVDSAEAGAAAAPGSGAKVSCVQRLSLSHLRRFGLERVTRGNDTAAQPLVGLTLLEGS